MKNITFIYIIIKAPTTFVPKIVLFKERLKKCQLNKFSITYINYY